MQVAKNVSEKFSSEKKCNYVVMDVNYITCGDCFTTQADIESLYWITETNEVICQLYLKTNNKGYHAMMTLLYIFLSIMCSITMAHTILNVPIVDIRDVFYNRESSE